MLLLRILPTALAAGGLAAALLAGGLHSVSETCTLEEGMGSPDAAVVPCSCVHEPDLDKRVASHVERAEMVLEVLVTSVDTLGGPLPDVPPPTTLAEMELRHPVVANLAVERSWKGEAAETDSLRMTDAWGPRTSCDVILVPGERYLLFASRDADTGRLRTHACTGTMSLARAAEEGYLERLGLDAVARGRVPDWRPSARDHPVPDEVLHHLPVPFDPPEAFPGHDQR